MENEFKPGDIIYAPYRVDDDRDIVDGWVAIYKGKSKYDEFSYYVMVSDIEEIANNIPCLDYNGSFPIIGFKNATYIQREFLYKALERDKKIWDKNTLTLIDMKEKYVEQAFNWKLAKDIILGKIKGYIYAHDAYRVFEILDYISLGKIGNVYITKANLNDKEAIVVVNTEGRIVLEDKLLDDKLRIYVENKDPLFEPFQKVLTRDKKENDWIADFFSHYDKDQDFPYVCVGAQWKYCIPYNEQTKHLLGTSDDYNLLK